MNVNTALLLGVAALVVYGLYRAWANNSAAEARGAADLFSTEAFRTLLDGPLILYRVGPDYRVKHSGGAALERLGLTPGQAVGKHLFDDFDPPEHVRQAQERVLSGESAYEVYLTSHPGPDGEDEHYKAWFARMADGDAVGVAVAITPAVRPLRTENARLRRDNARLSERLDEFQRQYDALAETVGGAFRNASPAHARD